MYQAAISTEMLSCCNLFDIAIDAAAWVTGEQLGLEAYLTSRTASIKHSGSGLPRFAKKLNAHGGIRIDSSGAYSPASPHSDTRVNDKRMRWLRDSETLFPSEASRWNKVMNHEITPISGRLGFTADEVSLGKALDGGVIGFGFDAAWQFAQDWGNPYLTPGQKVGRAIVSGSVGFVAGIGVVALVGTGPVGFAGALLVGWFVEAPVSEHIIFPFLGLTPTRNLARLSHP